MQSLDQLGAFLARRPLGQIGEFFRIIHSLDERLQDRPTALSQHIGKDAAEFQIRILKHLLNTRRVLRDFTHQLFAGARQIPQFLDRCRGHEARANQAMREQIGNPPGITHIGLAPRHVADVLSVGKHQLEVPFE